MSHPCPYDAMNSVFFFAVLHPKKSMKTDQFLSVFSNQKYTVQSPPKISFDQNGCFYRRHLWCKYFIDGSMCYRFPKMKTSKSCTFCQFWCNSQFWFHLRCKILINKDGGFHMSLNFMFSEVNNHPLATYFILRWCSKFFGAK